MSKAFTTFESTIKDAEDLLAHFDAMSKPAPPNAEVLKRAGLVMALTAWETYVEDRAREDVTRRLRAVSGSYVGKFVVARLEEELKRFHNPTADKTKRPVAVSCAAVSKHPVSSEATRNFASYRLHCSILRLQCRDRIGWQTRSSNLAHEGKTPLDLADCMARAHSQTGAPPD